MKIPETNIVLEKMPRRALNYYKHLRIVYFWSNFIKFGFLGMALILAVTTFLMRADLDVNRLSASFVVSGMLFSIFLFWQFFQNMFLKNLNDRRVNVFEDRVEIFQENGKDEKQVLNFNEVVRVGWGFFSFFGVFTVSTEKDVFRFSAFLHRAEYILEALEENYPQLFEKLDFEDLRNNVLSADHRLSRVHDMFFGRYKLLSLITYFLLPLIGTSLIVWQQVTRIQVNFLPDYIWSLVNIIVAVVFFVGMLHFMVTEFLFDRDLHVRVKEEFDDKGRDLEYEEGILARSNPAKIFAIILAFYSVLAFDFNQFGYYRINNSSADLNVLKDDVYLVDKRFNCLNCFYSLNKSSDIVFIYEDTLQYGKVVTSSERSPASIADLKDVEVKINDKGKVVSVPFQDILGKVIRDN